MGNTHYPVHWQEILGIIYMHLIHMFTVRGACEPKLHSIVNKCTEVLSHFIYEGTI